MNGMDVDRWIRQLTLLAMLLAALALLVMAVTLYGPRARSEPPAQVSSYTHQQASDFRTQARHHET
jgi:hypothetical protein